MATSTVLSTLPTAVTTAVSTASISGSVLSTISTALASTITSSASLTSSSSSSTSSRVLTTTTSVPPKQVPNTDAAGSAQKFGGISLVAFLTALATSLVVFGVQMGLFLLLRHKLARIFKPKTYLVPERERTEPPPASPWNLLSTVLRYNDREIIKKCGLDAYFFLRYLQTLLVLFIPIAIVVIPILIPINYVGGLGHQVVDTNTTDTEDSDVPTGLDTLAWGNVRPEHYRRRWAHLILALLVIIWVCGVFFAELRVYVKIRQDYLTSAEHRLRASANTVLVSSIPDKWLTEDALRGLFDVFPGGIRNVWLTRDFTKLLEKIHRRDAIHVQLEEAETELIREAKRRQLAQRSLEEKRIRKAHQVKAESKKERKHRAKAEDDEAKRRAEDNGGLSVGDDDSVPRDVATAVHGGEKPEGKGLGDIQEGESEGSPHHGPRGGNGLFKVGENLGRGLRKGVGFVEETGHNILVLPKALQQNVEGELERTGGFDFIKDGPQSSPTSSTSSEYDSKLHPGDDDAQPKPSFASETPLQASQARHAHTLSEATQASTLQKGSDPRTIGNTTRKVSNVNDMYITEKTRWYEFWKPPSGGYVSPVPQGYEREDYPWKVERTKWQKFKAAIPFYHSDIEDVEYPPAFTKDYATEKEEGAEWQKWLSAKDRPHHRLALFDWTPGWLPALPLLNKKVDTIYWCRAELAKLNLEIEEDQQHPERYPIMNSAFIQFNHQVAAHMACQSVTYHIPKQMAPRTVEISPNDVIWDNMAIKWWHEWARSALVFAVVTGMLILWAFPVAWTASLAQLDALVEKYSWLHWLVENKTIHNVIKGVAGVLPAAVLAILLILVPIALNWLATFQGAKTGSQTTETVQTYYFAFLFVQVFLVVSITSSTFQTIANITQDITSTPEVLAENLPKAANYFFSYMILQALSTSSGTLLQIGTLFMWYIMARILDNTARAKWTRNTQLPSVTWGSFFPVYTNFACIALIYSVVAPLISIFAIITFALLWCAHRYNMLYVTRFRTDTGGVLYPRAINQTFTGLYVMELCLIGLFFLAVDENDQVACVPQAIIMIIALILTILYQYLLNRSFGPLLRYLPITFEDEAVIRDEAFQRAQERRLGIIRDDDEATALNRSGPGANDGKDIELRNLHKRTKSEADSLSRLGKLNPVRGIVQAGSWAARGGRQVRQAAFGKAEENLRTATIYRNERRQKDIEAQRAIGDALFGGYHDEIEDLTPEERDVLVRKAFQHYALRARRPTVWIPRDDIGVSDDEIKRTQEFSKYIWISNEGTALDSKVRVVYGRNPPDFSEVDIINL
ncbi:DUF221-domain-containing protein [Neurospora tetrasperma FGSC 2509]|nr:DUF221-domain-containing protein [Neurospora tetrasperma FGSC 2509]